MTPAFYFPGILRTDDSEDFVEGGFALYGAKDSVHEHGNHAVLDGFFLEFEVEGAAYDALLDVFVYLEHFAQDEAFLVAGAVTERASCRNPPVAWNGRYGYSGAFGESTQNAFDNLPVSICDGGLFFACAEFSDEPLSHIGAARVYDIVRTDSH